MRSAETLRRLLAFFLCLALLITLPCAVAENRVINELEIGRDEERYTFPSDAELLEVYLPSILGADCCIMRMGDETLMIDAAYDTHTREGVIPALKALGISHIDTAYVSHPHDDHMKGFLTLLENGITFGRMALFFEEDANWISRQVVQAMKEAGVEIVHLKDGDETDFGKAHIRFLRRQRTDFTVNDLSGMMYITYGDCSYFTVGDIENRGQDVLMQKLPSFSLKCDIFKHPHHGYAPIRKDLLETVDPELVIVTGQYASTNAAIRLLNSRGYTWTRQFPEAIEMLCDGQHWLVRHPSWGSRKR